VEKIPKEYYDYFDSLYCKFDRIKVAVDIVVERIIGGGFEIVAGEGADKEKSREMIKVLVRKGAKPIAELVRHDPRTIAVVTSGKDELQGYAKIEDGKIIKRFNKDDIVHFKNPLISTFSLPYGID